MPQRKAYKAPLNEKGFVLITVLLIIALLFPLVLAFNSRVQLNLLQAENFRNSIQAQRAARLGIEGAIALLKLEDPKAPDTRRSNWAMSFPSYSVTEGGILTVGIVDEDGKLPINNVIMGSTQSQAKTGATTTAASTTQAKSSTTTATTTTTASAVNSDMVLQVKGLIIELGGRPEITDALIDWIDPDDIVTGSEGAEEAYYKPLGYHCKNGPLDSPDELLLIRGFDRDLVVGKNLKDFVTVAPVTGGVNVNTAPPEVLKVVLGTQTSQVVQPWNESDIENLVQYRDQHDISVTNDIMNAVKISQTQLSQVTNLLKVKSSYFTVTSKYTIDKTVKSVEALLKRDGTNVTIVSWREF